jgi:hypothetical protein
MCKEWKIAERNPELATKPAAEREEEAETGDSLIRHRRRIS